jgi:NAD(P)H dehydrogenase (quinone)
LKTILDEKLVPPSSLCISSYSSTGQLLDRAKTAGNEIKYGDMTKPETLVDSYSGADALFLVSYPSVGEERFKYHKVAIDAAKKASVKHILYTSLN